MTKPKRRFLITNRSFDVMPPNKHTFVYYSTDEDMEMLRKSNDKRKPDEQYVIHLIIEETYADFTPGDKVQSKYFKTDVARIVGFIDQGPSGGKELVAETVSGFVWTGLPEDFKHEQE